MQNEKYLVVWTFIKKSQDTLIILSFACWCLEDRHIVLPRVNRSKILIAATYL